MVKYKAKVKECGNAECNTKVIGYRVNVTDMVNASTVAETTPKHITKGNGGLMLDMDRASLVLKMEQ